jgi:hypothetical protein
VVPNQTIALVPNQSIVLTWLATSIMLAPSAIITDPQLLDLVGRDDYVLVTDNGSDVRRLFARERIHPGLIVMPGSWDEPASKTWSEGSSRGSIALRKPRVGTREHELDPRKPDDAGASPRRKRRRGESRLMICGP